MVHPPRPSPPFFDESRDAWVLSRYRDVTAALRDPALWPVASRGEDQATTRDEAGRLRLRAPVQEALARFGQWRTSMESHAREILASLDGAGTADLLTEYALPWCREVALSAVQAPPELRERLSALSAEVFAATGSPEDSPLRPRAAAATAELDRLLKDGPMPMGEPTLVAISQTTPRLLANVWTALLSQPEEAARLQTDPTLWPCAVDELLRFAGIVRRIWRQARIGVWYEGAEIAAGQRVLLLLASANRDPDQFPDPDRLDVARSVPGQVALGLGRNSCAGVAVVRAAIEISTHALWSGFPELEAIEDPEYLAGSGYAFPTKVPVRLKRHPTVDPCT